MRAFIGLLTLVALTALASSAAAESPSPGASTIDIDAVAPPRGAGVNAGALREAIAERPAGDTAVVEVVHDLSDATARKLVGRGGGRFLADSAQGVTEAVVPLREIAALEATPGVRYVRQPLRASVPLDSASPQLFVGDEIAETNADGWHTAGYFGAGVKVGMIDFFDGTLWADAQAAGEVPAPAGTFCSLFGSTCDVFDPQLGDAHGIATSEIVHEMAPQAQLYIAFAWTTGDTQAAVDYFASQGVDVISRSLTSTYDGPGDGTGPLADVIDSAVSQGMVWVNSAGNSASSSGTSGGSYWRGAWDDTDGDGFLNFSGTDEVFNFYCGFLNGLRWNDWGLDPTDYDVYIFDTPGGVNTFTPKYTSLNDQGGGFDPLEIVDDGPACNGASDLDHLAIHLFDPGAGTAGDILELMGNQTTFEYSQNPYSATGPATDSANPGMMAVGAMTGTGPTIATYSSQGPTNDGRMKPDLAASSCVDSYAYQPGCFAGTSASAPGVAGATALVIGSGLASDPVSARSWLLANATVDRGAAGPDNVYGTGELIFSSAPPDVDADARTDAADNCPNWYNPTQALPPWPVPPDDAECDGFSATAEAALGTDSLSHCPAVIGVSDAWPPDFTMDRVVNITDVLAIKPAFNQPVTTYPRFDLVPGGALINIADVLAMKNFFSKTCVP